MTIRDNRRSAYRSHPDDAESLSVELHAEAGKAKADEILNITVNGAGVLFPATGAPLLKPGAGVKLRVNSAEFDEPIEIEATVITATEVDQRHLYGLRFDRADRLLAEAAGVFRIFNRRAAYRGITPEALTAKLKFPPQFRDETLYEVPIRNVSTTGLCILTDSDLDEMLEDTEVVEVFLNLPDDSESLHFHAQIRHRMQHGAEVFYGLRFDPKATDDYLNQAEHVLEYMFNRFDEELLKG